MLLNTLQWTGQPLTTKSYHPKISVVPVTLTTGGRGCQRMTWLDSHWLKWTWTWANSTRWWGTGHPGMLPAMGSQRVGHGWATEQQQQRTHGCPGRKTDPILSPSKLTSPPQSLCWAIRTHLNLLTKLENSGPPYAFTFYTQRITKFCQICHFHGHLFVLFLPISIITFWFAAEISCFSLTNLVTVSSFLHIIFRMILLWKWMILLWKSNSVTSLHDIS